MKRGVIIILALLVSTCIVAQEPVEKPILSVRGDSINNSDSTNLAPFSWMNLGLGRSMDYPIAFTIGLNYQFEKYLVSVRFLITDEFDLHKQSSSETIWDAGVLFGRLFKNHVGMASFSVGLSYVGGLKRGAYISEDDTWGGYYKMEHRATIGIPLESQFVYTLSRNVGIGLTAFGNLNLNKPFFGALLSLQVGIIR